MKPLGSLGKGEAFGGEEGSCCVFFGDVHVMFIWLRHCVFSHVVCFFFLGEKAKFVCQKHEWHVLRYQTHANSPYISCAFFLMEQLPWNKRNSPSLSGAGGRREVSVLV